MPDGSEISKEIGNNSSSVPSYEGAMVGPTIFPKFGEGINYNADPNLPGGDKKTQELNDDQIEALINSRIRTSHIEKFTKNLTRYDGFPDEQKSSPEIVETMQLGYEKMIMGGIKEALKFHKKLVSQKKNGYPYESRTAELTIDAVGDAADELTEAGALNSPEALLYVKRMREDTAWLGDHFTLTVENTASLFGYFDLIQQMQVIKVPNRPYISGDNLEEIFAAKVDENGLNANEANLANTNKIGIRIPDKYVRSRFAKPGEEYKQGEALGIRDLAVSMTSSSFEARMKIAAVSQVDFTKPNPLGTTFMEDNLSRDDFDFYSRLLWRTKGDEGFILAPNIVSAKEEKKEAEAALEALLTTNAVERLDVIKGLPAAQKEAEMSALLSEVKGEMLDRITNWRTRENKDIVSSLATLITKQGLLQDYSFMHGYRYCFQGVWKMEDRKPVELKKWDSAGIYSHSGDLYSMYYLHRHHGYNQLANTDTPFLRPTSKAGRARWAKLPLNETPHFNENLNGHPDQFLKEQWDFVFGTSPEAIKLRKEMGYDSLPKEVADKLISWATIYTTPFTAKYLESLEDRDRITSSYELELPWFLPEGNSVANFFESITTGEKKLNFGGKSVMQELIEGKKLYDINWKGPGVDNQPVDRWHVDMEMSSRWMRLLIEDFEADKDGFYQKLTHSPSTHGIKELNKRIRLWARDSSQGQPEFFEIGFIPMLVVFAAADKHGLFGAAAWEPQSDADKKTQTIGLERFTKEMAYWKRAFNWLPGDRPSPNLRPGQDGGLKYGNSMALMAEFFETVVTRIAKASAEESFDLAIKNYDKTVARQNKYPYLQKGRFKVTINKNASLRK